MDQPTDNWSAARADGLSRLQAFVPRAGRAYARMRNFDRGPGQHTDVSTLSPWIRHRLILEEEVVSAVLERHRLSDADKFIQEVCWRTYWKGWLELRPGVWEQYCRRVDDLVKCLEENDGLRARWESATAARTGIECFDHWARELTETGYLHNHARMWFASVWIFTLNLPWELGADFFLRHLLDGDPASNTLSWRWVAGLQTRGKTYLARSSNIAKFTGGRFRPADDLASRAPPVEGPPHPEPGPLPEVDERDPNLPTGVLITEDDLYPESLFGNGWPSNQTAALKSTARRSPLAVSRRVLSFVDDALRDLRRRLADVMPSPGRLDVFDSSAAVVDWATSCGLRQVLIPYPPVGPTADLINAVDGLLEKNGIRMVRVQRKWDRVSWPHATGGFFRFRKHIPQILKEVGITPGDADSS